MANDSTYCPCIPCLEGSPFLNLSAEGPEAYYWRAIGFCCDGSMVVGESIESYDDAYDEMRRQLVLNAPDCGPNLFFADATCPDGTILATVSVLTSQADADALAAKMAAEMLPYCGTGELFQATRCCPDGITCISAYSAASQAEAEQRVNSMPLSCPPPCNTPQTCSVVCPDGTIFYYTVPACTIYAPTLAEANAQAYALACQRAARMRVCLGPIDACCCVGEAYNGTIKLTGGAAGALIDYELASGTLPSGMVFHGGGRRDGKCVIDGTPDTGGTYTFTVRATTGARTYAEHTYTVRCIQITTTTLPAYFVGAAYSQQLVATGGSGNYAWKVTSGTLPDGITLDSTGLLHGTPTGGAGGGTLEFEVIDTTCEATNRTFFPPRVALVTSGTSTVKTRCGWPNFLGSTVVLYKRATWDGWETQVAYPQGNTWAIDQQQCALAKYILTGEDRCDIYGREVTRHQFLLMVPCVKDFPHVGRLYWVNFNGEWRYDYSFDLQISELPGYCWPTDPESCATCTFTEESLVPAGDYGSFNPAQVPPNIVRDHNAVATETVKHYSGSSVGYWAYVLTRSWQPDQAPENPQPPINFPTNNWLDTLDQSWAFMTTGADGDWTITLSDPFTDAEADQTKQVYHNSLAVAENYPEYTRWGHNTVTFIQSRITVVNYTINCTNLVPGEKYRVSWELVASNGSGVSQFVDFTASVSTYAVVGTVPTPAEGQTRKIRNARITYI